jgi:uncharacterized protein
MPRVIHFEIPVDQPDRAVSFYTKVFGWKVDKWEGAEPYWLITTGEKGQMGIDGAIMKRTSPVMSTCNTIDVPSIEEFTAKITANGGKIISPKMPIPGIGYFSYCQDTEGNTFGILQPDKSAK